MNMGATLAHKCEKKMMRAFDRRAHAAQILVSARANNCHITATLLRESHNRCSYADAAETSSR
jgi:hypothetical protein